MRACVCVGGILICQGMRNDGPCFASDVNSGIINSMSCDRGLCREFRWHWASSDFMTDAPTWEIEGLSAAAEIMLQ